MDFKLPEKTVTERVETAFITEQDEAPPFDEKATSRLLRKIDWVLLPFLSLLYLYVSHRLPFHATDRPWAELP
jgi:hypothetical protein